MTDRKISAAVLVSAGRHPESGIARPCRGDAVALCLARQLVGDGLRVVHAGAADEPALQDYLAFGAGAIEVLSIPSGADALMPLTDLLAGVDLIITGSRAELGAGSGLLPYALAQTLGRPIVSNVLTAELNQGDVVVRQFLPKGRRRRIAAPLPAILAVHPLAPFELHYAYARRLAGRIYAMPSDHQASSGASPRWSVDPVKRRPVRLKAVEKKSGHARMLSATVSEAKDGTVAIEGSCVDKAQVMLSFLREHRLVNF